jgi:hypothetical protein
MVISSKFLEFDPDYLTYPSILRSYLNIYAIFDCGNARSNFDFGPTLDCGQSSDDFVILIFDAESAVTLNFSTRFAFIEYLEKIYPDQSELDLLLDAGNSTSTFIVSPAIDCGNAGDYNIPPNHIFEWTLKND